MRQKRHNFMNYILTIDAGTSEFKAVLFDKNFEISGLARREFGVINPQPGRTEFDTEEYWNTCIKTARDAIKDSSVNPGDISAISVTSHTDTLFVLDEFGKPLSNAILWTDARAVSQAEKIQKYFGLERIFKTTGQTGASYIHFASRLLWFIENNPGLLNKIKYFLQTQDYLIFRLSGVAAQDHSITSSSLLGYLEKKEYWQEMLSFIGVSEEKLCRIISPGGIAGSLTDDAAEKLGFLKNIPVVAGGMDAIASAFAMNNTEEGIITEITGSALVIGATCDKPKFDKEIRVPCFVHAVKGKYLLMPWNETAGMALKWYRDQFFKTTEISNDKPSQNLYDLISSEAAEAPPGCEGIILLPHFAGSGSPDFNPDAKAVIYGLNTTHKRKHISRAFLESVAFLLKQNLDVLTKMGIKMERIISSGGGSKSGIWCQIKADVTGLPVSVYGNSESTAKGAAILAANAIGWLSDEAVKPAENDLSVFIPDSGACHVYKKVYRQFINLNRYMKAFFKGNN
jgi:sugar (pentulose or hexulose) kinase